MCLMLKVYFTFEFQLQTLKSDRLPSNNLMNEANQKFIQKSKYNTVPWFKASSYRAH